MASGSGRLRAGALVLAGALAVHELRYLIAGRHPDEHLHAYMAWLVPVACALVGLAAAELAARLVAHARNRRARTDDVPAGVRWLTASVLLTAIFSLQEVGEQLVGHGRVDVVESLAVHGGWLALPLCFVIGALIAVLLRGARALLTRAWSRTRTPRGRVPDASPRLPRSHAPRVAAIACNLAGRAPPVVV